ncbi:Mu-like prophage major head subunit gpT family protein [Shewanella khirikhana]|uniref:Mu-like prophage major head subunit gpT n=1 Tax=Shewanella khirikhana TaxID=1965282 RepID=A0ABN5TS34_9GAMM|nr:Mu-like prophage major head subunit gpT family protein [Shewanella khirikhana]AZQ10119.1 Mu-like prophage major head subunit gpT [Shewanella khirikhana]
MPAPIDINAVVIESATAFAARFDGGMSSAKPDYPQVATVLPSSAGATGYGWLGDFPRLKEWIGARQFKELKKHGYNIVNKLFESSVKIPRVDYEDNDYGRYGIVFEEMGYDSKIYPDEYIFGLLKDGFTELCYDGQPFFDADHPSEDGVNTFSNVIGDPDTDAGPGWYLLDTSRPLKPLVWQERLAPEFQSVTESSDFNVFTTDDYYFGTRARGNAGFTFWQMAFASKAPLTEANFELMITKMMEQKNSEGKSLKVKPTLLVVPVSLRAAAEKIVLRKTLENGEDNTNFKAVDILVSQDL